MGSPVGAEDEVLGGGQGEQGGGDAVGGQAGGAGEAAQDGDRACPREGVVAEGGHRGLPPPEGRLLVHPVQVAEQDVISGEDGPASGVVRRPGEGAGEQDRHRQPADQRGLPEEVPHPAEQGLAHQDREDRAGQGHVPGHEGRQGQRQQQARQRGVRPPQQRRRPRDAVVDRLGRHAPAHAQGGHPHRPPPEKDQPDRQRGARGHEDHPEDSAAGLGGVEEGRAPHGAGGEHVPFGRAGGARAIRRLRHACAGLVPGGSPPSAPPRVRSGAGARGRRSCRCRSPRRLAPRAEPPGPPGSARSRR